jgi:hypothetical protein
MLQRYFRIAFLGSLLIFVLGAANLPAQYTPPPDAYSISYTISLMMPNQQVKIYRNGNRVVTEDFVPRSGRMQGTIHTRDFLDLVSHQQWTLDLQDPSVPCGASTQAGPPGDWSGNPFEWPAFFGIDLSKLPPPQAGTETAAGRKARVFELPGPGGQKGRIWVDAQYGLLLKMAGPGENGRPEIPLEVKSFTSGEPPASVFVMPGRCGKAAGAAAWANAANSKVLPPQALLPGGTQVMAAWADGTPLSLKPQEQVAFIFLTDIKTLEMELNRYISMQELVKGVKTRVGLRGLTRDPAQDRNYSYTLTGSGQNYRLTVVPRRPGLGGWLVVGGAFSADIYFNPRGPASTNDKKIGNYSVSGDTFQR